VLVTVLFVVWAALGTIAIGLARIVTPPDTPEGRKHPDVAWLAWTVMLIFWPLTVWNRKKFVRHGEAADKGNPSWLVNGRE
jgi:hypothetical protein